MNFSFFLWMGDWPDTCCCRAENDPGMCRIKDGGQCPPLKDKCPSQHSVSPYTSKCVQLSTLTSSDPENVKNKNSMHRENCDVCCS